MLTKSVGNPEFKWLEDKYGGRYAKASGAYGVGDTTLTVSGAGSSSANIFTAGDVIKIARTGENLYVSARASATTLTVTRSLGSTAATAIADGDGIFLIGNVNEENASARNVNTTQTSEESNYTQIFRRSIAVSNTQKAAENYGPSDLVYQRAKLGTEHALDIERAFWFGEKSSDTSGTQSHPRRATGGVLEFIESSNSFIQNQGGVLTAPDMNTFLREGFTYGDNHKTLICGGLVLQSINEMARGQLVTKGTDKTYGIKIQEWQTTFGTINLIHNPLFVEDYAGYAFLLDMNCFKKVVMNGRDTQLRTNIQAPDTDGQVDEYLTEAGLERVNAPLCALLKGVTA